MSIEKKGRAALEEVLEALLGPQGCPWDQEQTPDSLCEYLAEETFEFIDAVRRGNLPDIREEMGDMAFQFLFLARFYKKSFSLDEAMQDAATKMIRRHPHVFADQPVENMEDLLRTWDEIKKKEKPKVSGVFASLPRDLPPLLKSYRIHSKAAGAGFTWDEDADVEQQAEAEWLELLDALSTGGKEQQEHELGDLIFTLVELGRRKGIKANAALDKSALRFLDRFARMEKEAAESGSDFASLSMEEKNMLWDKAKGAEKQP